MAFEYEDYDSFDSDVLSDYESDAESSDSSVDELVAAPSNVTQRARTAQTQSNVSANRTKISSNNQKPSLQSASSVAAVPSATAAQRPRPLPSSTKSVTFKADAPVAFSVSGGDEPRVDWAESDSDDDDEFDLFGVDSSAIPPSAPSASTQSHTAAPSTFTKSRAKKTSTDNAVGVPSAIDAPKPPKWIPFPEAVDEGDANLASSADAGLIDMRTRARGGGVSVRIRLGNARVKRTSADTIIEELASRSEFSDIVWTKVGADTYIFGQRKIRVQVDTGARTAVVVLGQKRTPLAAFLPKQGRCERLRLRALSSGLMMYQQFSRAVAV